MDKLKMETSDMAAENIEKIGALFPSAVTEMRGEDGSIKKGVNFEMLKQLLSPDVVEEGDERYEFTWVGKKQAIAEAARPTTKTLRPVKEDSRNWDATENLYIEGDNLEVLKILQESYLGKVKMIYIDPPYNTGHDFIYRDDFGMSREEWSEKSGELSEDGDRLFENTESNGRFHSDWCSMTYSRLMLARNLLTEDGVVFISLDDGEIENLREICNEVFGEQNFLAQCVRKRRDSQANLSKNISPIHEYVVLYAKSNGNLLNKISAHINERDYKNPDNDPRGPYKTMPCTNKGGAIYSVMTPSGKTITEEWRFKRETYDRLLNDNRLVFPRDGDGKPRYKLFLSEKKSEGQLANTWLDFLASNQEATREIKSLFGNSTIFSTPKPVELIKFCMDLATKTDSIVLDFFSGSATTAHAVMQLNAEDGGHRKFIMVQLPEPCDENSEAFKAGYKNICEIGKERIRRAGEKIKEENPLTTQNLDIGFRVFRVDESNMKNVYYHPEEVTQLMLGETVSNIKEDRTDLDLLYACLLDWGVEINLSHTSTQVAGCTVHNVDNGALAACFDKAVPRAVVEYIANLQPLRAVFRDSAFATDAEKINVTEIFKNLSPDTKVKLYAGQISGNEQMTALQRRIQIRETIRTHIQRERELYPRGIKVLSLFFIDEVSKYRLYDGDNDDGRNGEYAKMFEEEYENVVGQMQRQFGDDAYLHYLDGIDVHKTHQGYFSIDKKKGKKARFVEGKIDRKTQLSDDVDAYDLIMKDKERLLSLDEPVRFIFSHSALREGWDNPNVFQICTLKPQSESEIRSRQEIGRGLRLCVNQQGERMDESVLGRDVQELNKLTLITDLEYGKFAEALQTGLAESLADRPQKVDTQLFVGRTLVDANGEQVHVTQDLANAIYEDLIQNDYVKRGKLTDKYFADKEIGSFHVASEVSGYADSVVRILSGVYDAHTMAPENAHSNNVQAIVDEEKLHKAEFLNLWNRINHKSFYTVQFDTPELIDHSIRALDSKLNVTRVQINLEYGEQTARLESREQLEQGKGFQKARSDRESAKYAPLGSVRYDLVGKLVEETGLTRATVAAILRGIAPQTFSQFRINPEEFILKAARLINDEKATQIIEHITYNRLDAAYDQDVFTRATLRGKLDVNAMEANRSLYSHVIYDSDNERRFAQELDVSDQVAVYVKLPGSFYISTPVGKYNPDWAIAFNEGSVKHIYFVAETKGNLDTMELRGVENAKIECAKKHFAAISNGSVVYSVVDNYSTLMQLVSN